jgi:integrase
MSYLRQSREPIPGGGVMKRRPHALIRRRNFKDTRSYLDYCRDVRQNSRGTLQVIRVSMDHLLRWSTSVPLQKTSALRPTLPAYLQAMDISVSYRKKLLSYTRRFFRYAERTWPARYERVSYQFIESLRAKDKPGIVKKREIYTIEEIRQICSLTPRTITEERDIAAVAFLFLSGMRVSAFATLPLKLIQWDYEPLPMVNQWPDYGVKTKNGDPLNSFLLARQGLEDLHEIAEAWARKAEAAVGSNGLYYTLLTTLREFDPIQVPGRNRGGDVARQLKSVCRRAGVAYKSPHKIRHGHVVWALKRCGTLEDLKAVSQNVGHSSLKTTDEIYANLMGDDVAKRIARLGQTSEEQEQMKDLVKEQVKEQMKELFGL